MVRGSRYSSWWRPFRLQLSWEAARGFVGPADRGRCRYEGCGRFEWCEGARYCRDHWLEVYQQERLPDRLEQWKEGGRR